MKKYLATISILACLVLIALSFRVTGGKYGPHLSYVLDKTNQDHFIVWIYLRDKGPDVQQKLSNPLSLVTQRSLDRRKNVKNANQLVEEADVPVYEPYVNEISTKTLSLRQQAKWLNALSAEVNKEQLSELSNLNYVIQIELVETYKRMKDDIESSSNVTGSPINIESKEKNNILVDTLSYGTFGTTQITQMNVNLVHDQGIYGQGILICSQDDGFRNQSHPCFTNPANPLRLIAQYDFQLHLPGAFHTNATHGTTTISCIGAYMPGTLIGTAFKSSFLAARTEVDTFERPIEMDNWLAASQWADSLGANIITSSLGYLVFDSVQWNIYSWMSMDGKTMPVTRAAAIASHNGILVFNSAGNNGPGSHNTLNGPADADSIITMGAVQGNGIVTGFSSVGPTTDNPPRIKPDVMAMGQGVQTANGFGSGYSNGGSAGTSYSCPLAAGVGALILSANKNLTPLQVRGILRKFANNSSNPNNTYGWGIIDASQSVDSARKLDTQPPVITHTQPFTITNSNLAVTMKARITDNGIIRIWPNQAPLCYYRSSTNGGATWTPFNPLNNSYYNNVDSFFFQIPGFNAGTTVQYYFAAQDIALPTPLVTTLPAGGGGINPPGTTPPPTRFQYNVVAVGIVKNSNETPKEFKLYSNYPNPFNPSTIIKFDIAKASATRLIVYDILGREVTRILDEKLSAGSYTVDFKGDELSSGVYFYKLVTDSYVDTKRMLLVK